MKKLSFDNIKNIEFPESWIEKALNVPSQQPKKTLLPFETASTSEKESPAPVSARAGLNRQSGSSVLSSARLSLCRE